MNQRSRSAYGTAAFAGDVDGSTKSAGRADRPQLRPELGPLGEEAAVCLLADERDRARFELARDPLEPRRVEVAAPQVARAGRRAVRGVGDAETELEQVELLGSGRSSRGVKPGVVQQPPEVVARVREVGRRGRRDAPGVDAAEDAAQPRREDVRDGARRSVVRTVRPRGLQRGMRCVHVAVQTHELGSGGAGRRPAAVGVRAAASTSGRRASCRLLLRPARVEPPLEQSPHLLAARRQACAGRRPAGRSTWSLRARRSTGRSTRPR